MSDLDRRAFLSGGLALGALGWGASRARGAVQVFLPRAAAGGAPDPRTLVLLQLSGGNDGLSTVVPHADDAYHAARDRTRIRAEEVLRLDEYRGLHPALKRLREVYDAGRLAIVEGCGYPDPVRSHFKSMEIWHTASHGGRDEDEGWIGRLCGARWGADAPTELVVHVGASAPYSIRSRAHPAIAFEAPQAYQWVAAEAAERQAYRRAAESGPDSGGEAGQGPDGVLHRLRGVLADAQASSLRVRRAAAGYTTGIEYPNSDLGRSLRVAAALADARIGTRVISCELGGFDSHNGQRGQHDGRMRELDAALGAFLEDVHGRSIGRELLVVAFSEFGRRVKENGSAGTDHGTAGPVLVAGTGVRGGVYGRHPSLTELDAGDLVHTTDFRSVYGTVIERWFGVETRRVLGAPYPSLDFLPA